MQSRNLYYDTNRSDIFLKTVNGSTASEDDVLINLGFRDPHTREIKVGKMPNNPDLDIVLENGDVYHIPKGYHSGKGIVRVQELSLGALTQGTATSGDIAKNKVAWVNGIRLVGTLDLNRNNMEASAKPEDIAFGKDAWVRNEHIYGTMPVHMRQDRILYAGEYYIIPKGYHGGEAIVSTASLELQTKATATEKDIDIGKSAWANGRLLVGERPTLETTLSASTASIRDIRRSKTAYIASGLVNGDMDEYLNHPTTTVHAGDTFIIPTGYHDGLWKIQVDSLYNQTKATATAADIRKNKTAWVNGEMVYGEMVQEYCPDSPGTALSTDIARGKVAWVNGERVVGTSKYNSISYYFNEDNMDDHTSPIVAILPSHQWKSIDTIIVEFYDGELRVRKQVFHNVLAGNHIQKNNGDHELLSIVTTLGSPRVIVTNFNDLYHMEVTICGYSVVNFDESDGENDGID